jgi:hypothetical protein
VKHEVKRKIDLPGGGSVTVTVQADEPIREEDFMVLRPQAAIEMAECLKDLASALRPKDPS